MKPSRNLFLYGVISLLAIGLTIVSLQFVRPILCTSFCDPAMGVFCPSDSCLIGEQRAGLPLPIWVDYPGGGSPTDGWAILGPEDPLNPLTFLLDTIFYFALLGLLWYFIQIIRGNHQTMKPLVVFFFLLVIVAGILLGIVSYLPFLPR
jgi:hypothetical protein